MLKPGGHLLAFGSPRTAHRLAAGLEDAGLKLRDTLLWLYGTGMPKSRRLPGGRGTTLKPAYEPIILARKPPQSTVRRTIARHGTGALNTEACRVGGRYPANILASHAAGCTDRRCDRECPLSLIDEAADDGRAPSPAAEPASRIFYCPKTSRRERDAGCEQLPARELDLFPHAPGQHQPPAPARNPHPTVKPLSVMRWLVRLSCPPGGLVLDPFCGSGSTGAAAALEGFRFLGIELEPDYARVAEARIAHWAHRQADARDLIPFSSRRQAA